MDGPAPTNPPRAYYRLGEVARMLRVAPSAVRYWQQEFHPHVHPARTRSGQNVYSRRDVAVLARIRALVHEERLSIKDARERLRAELAANDGEPVMADIGIQAEMDFSPRNATPRTDVASPPEPAADAAPSPDADRLQALEEALATAHDERDRLQAALDVARRQADDARTRQHTLVSTLARAIRELSRDID